MRDGSLEHQAAIEAIHSHLQRGDLSDGLVFDAVRIRLLEIGEAVKALPAELLNTEPAIPRTQIARMRDRRRWSPTTHLDGKLRIVATT